MLEMEAEYQCSSRMYKAIMSMSVRLTEKGRVFLAEWADPTGEQPDANRCSPALQVPAFIASRFAPVKLERYAARDARRCRSAGAATRVSVCGSQGRAMMGEG